MVAIVSLLVFLSVTLVLGAFGAQVTLAPRRAALRRLRDIRPVTFGDAAATVTAPSSVPARGWRRLLPAARAASTDVIKVVGLTPDTPTARLLLYAGYRSASALRTFQVVRATCAVGLMAVPLIVSRWRGLTPAHTVLLMSLMMLAGYVLPRTVVRMKARRLQHRLRLSLPDALDLLVVCVEAGMGLNQAIVRVSEELSETHPEIAEEFRLVNLEIRAGRTRQEALRSLGERTGVDDIISLASMIIQTDRFGTSIARSLRVHSDGLRTERRQRAEEAAAKTTIKLIFPLLFCIFPSLFVTILGPAALHLMKIFGPGAGS